MCKAGKDAIAGSEASVHAYEFMRSHRAYFEDFVTRSTYHSNAIEGSTLSYAETYAILWNDNTLKIRATARELYEAINYKYALSVAFGDEDARLSEGLIKKIGVAVNRNISEIGGYRTTRVGIRAAEHIPPSPEQVRFMMTELVHAYNSDIDQGRDAYLREAEFHVRFERIHPFEDGNGRTGRILLNRGLLLSGCAPAVISIDDRAEYMSLIANIDIEGLSALLRRLADSEVERMEAFR